MKAAWTIPTLAAFVVILDAGTKAWALANLQPGLAQPFIPGLLHLTLTSNTGGAFSIGRQHKIIMTILPLLICAAIICWLISRERKGYRLSALEQVAFSLVLGGALGNLCDRFARGRVTDFLDFAFMTFPIFNVADAFIDIGVALLLLHSVTAGPRSAGEDRVNDSNG